MNNELLDKEKIYNNIVKNEEYDKKIESSLKNERERIIQIRKSYDTRMKKIKIASIFVGSIVVITDLLITSLSHLSLNIEDKVNIISKIIAVLLFLLFKGVVYNSIYGILANYISYKDKLTEDQFKEIQQTKDDYKEMRKHIN